MASAIERQRSITDHSAKPVYTDTSYWCFCKRAFSFRNGLQEKEVDPTLGELMESKIKVLDPHGRVVCTKGQALSALRAQASSVPVDGRLTTRIANAVAHCSCV